MLSFKPKQFSYKEIEKNIIDLEFNKKYLLNSEKIKENIYTPSRIPSCVSTSQEYQIETNKIPKVNSSDKHNKLKGNFIIFKDYNNINSVSTKKVSNKNNVKKALSVDKIGKNNAKVNDNNIKNDKNNKNFNEKNNVKKEMNEIVQNFIDNNLQNNKNFNFFRLFKMKRKNQNYNEKEIFPPLYVNSKPVETEQNAIDKNENKYINLLTKQNEDNIGHYRDTLINSVNKKTIKDNKIFVKIDEHFNKLKKDKSPKMIKKDYGIIKNIKSNNINNLINISANGKNINKINNDIISKQNCKSLPHEKFINYKNTIEKSPLNNNNENNKSHKNEEKIKYINNIKKKNRLKIKLNTPNSNNIYINKEEFNLKNKKKINRKNTPNIFINNNNNIINTIDINNNINNKINFEFDKKIKNKKIETVDDNILGDSFRDELNIIISDVNNCKKDNNIMTKENHQDYSIECADDIKINLNDINYNDDSIEKNIPKEQEERINLIKKFNRPETSYGKQKNLPKNKE